MKYINFKRYKFSTVVKKFNTLVYNFLKIFKSIDLKRYDFNEGGRKFRVEHGDAYEKGAFTNRMFVKILSVLQNILEFAFNFDFTTWWTEIQIKKHKLRSIINILRHHPDVEISAGTVGLCLP